MIETSHKETIVRQRYAAGAKESAGKLCCPVNYSSEYLKVIPQEVIERDYGCGDPSRYLHGGETVLDLGSGTGKICFIAAQIVGPKAKVIGVDMRTKCSKLRVGNHQSSLSGSAIRTSNS